MNFASRKSKNAKRYAVHMAFREHMTKINANIVNAKIPAETIHVQRIRIVPLTFKQIRNLVQHLPQFAAKVSGIIGISKFTKS